MPEIEPHPILSVGDMRLVDDTCSSEWKSRKKWVVTDALFVTFPTALSLVLQKIYAFSLDCAGRAALVT